MGGFDKGLWLNECEGRFPRHSGTRRGEEESSALVSLLVPQTGSTEMSVERGLGEDKPDALQTPGASAARARVPARPL